MPPPIIDLASSSEDDENDDVRVVSAQPGSTLTSVARHARLRDHQPRIAWSAEPEGAASEVVPGADPPVMATPPHLAEDQRERPGAHRGGSHQWFGDEMVWIPDDSPPLVAAHDSPTTLAAPSPPRFRETDQIEDLAAPNPISTIDECLQRVLEIFPDVSHEYITKLYTDFDQGSPPMTGADRYENIVNKLAETDGYPKQSKGKDAARKRKPEDDLKVDDFKRWEGADRQPALPASARSIAAALKADYPDVPTKIIREHLSQHHNLLFQTYVAIAVMRDSRETGWTGRPQGRHMASADSIVLNSGVPELHEELRAARQRVSIIRAERAIEQAKRQAEEANLERAMEAGDTAECQACFDLLPMNRQIHCSGDTPHFTCFDCITTYIKSEIGQSRCNVTCTAGCGSHYAYAQLQLLEESQLLEKLAQLQQEKDIRDAGLDDLAECPFCDYKAILPPIEEDFEFRCANPGCEKVSCRRCKAASHIPVSCEERVKDHKLNSRHQIEEAMTAALVRKCNKCSKPFIKEFGCNKMSCPSCRNLQCYVCSETVQDYNHFDQNPSGVRNQAPAGPSVERCPLYDNVEERHEREIKEAEAQARAEALAANPDITEEDLQIKESDGVRKAAEAKTRRHGGFPNYRGDFPARLRLFNEAGLGFDANLDDDGAHPRAIAALHRRIPHRHPLRIVGQNDEAARAQRIMDPQTQLARDMPDRTVNAHIGLDAALDPLRHGIGGHIAGHGAQAHLAGPQPAYAYQGLAQPRWLQRPPLPTPNVFGYMTVYGMPTPHQGPMFQQAPVEPVTHPAPGGSPFLLFDRPGRAQNPAADLQNNAHYESDRAPRPANNGLGGR